MRTDPEANRPLPTVRFGGAEYVVDPALGQFRHAEKPWVVVAFDSMEGEALMAATGIVLCPHCRQVLKHRAGARPARARCPGCNHPLRLD